ncbi:GTP cyclohydrolase II RibA [Luteimonas sp. BDR2-5]|uniref:GTP cyclohydrolase II RibA n=1 Tax=Proluteimonas luteida TaxID=2878685 RepID=UPI001E3AD486|nr:GTP cyclohydrolase II RibA [Luteimonas sp. BDR2-5]MCD9027359.1 GTP cyclohydrolase II RibA [Luteimonas sp. BDR2-5]
MSRSSESGPPASVPPSSAAALFGDPAVIRCERAVSELRQGRPVVIAGPSGARLAFITLDGSTAGSYARFARAAGDRQHLTVTARRADVLGLQAPDGARIPLAGVGHDALGALGFLRDAGAPAHWQPATALDAAGVELARLGLMLPALIAVDLGDGDSAFAACCQVSIADLEAGSAGAADDFELVTRAPVPLRDVGMTDFVVFRGGVAQRDQVAVVVGNPDVDAVVPVRVHSSCLTGDLFGSLKCDCGDQLRAGLLALKALGGGVLLYLDQEGRGTGIAAKMRAYGYQHEGLDTIDADAQLGFGADERRYGTAAAMLQGLGIRRVALLTNNPDKVARLREAGIDVVERHPLTGHVTAENEQYLRTKARRAGHALDVDALIRAME